MPSSPQIWDSKIPSPILRDIHEIIRTTKRTGREASITICRRPAHKRGRVFVGAASVGTEHSTEVLPCDQKYGIVDRVGDVHTHPVAFNAIGIIPSEADLTGYIRDSYMAGARQIGCVSNHYAPYIMCMQPKTIPDRRKVNQYEMALENNPWPKSVDPYFLENVARDFNTSFYDKETGRYEPDPPVKDIIKAAFTRAGPYTRAIISKMSRTAFCQYIQDLTVPSNDEIADACREELEDREFLGIQYEKYLKDLNKYGFTDAAHNIYEGASQPFRHANVIFHKKVCRGCKH